MAVAEKSSHKFFQEDEELLTPDCRALLQTLPSCEKGFGPAHLYLYRGFWFPARILNAILSVQQNFQAHDSDILIATTPKAGTTWLKALVFALVNRSQYPINSINNPMLQKNPHDLVLFLENNLYFGDPDPDLSSIAAPRLFSTHIPFSSLPSSVQSSSKSSKIIYMCRNPKDTLISLWHFNNKIAPEGWGTTPLEEEVDKFCRGVSPGGPFWDHALEYWKASEEMPDKVLFLKYEDIKEKPCEQVRLLAKFVGCPFSQEEEANGQVEEIVRLCSFNNLSGLEVNRKGETQNGIETKVFFRRGQVGDWFKYLTQEMIERLDHITEEKLHGSTLKLP